MAGAARRRLGRRSDCSNEARSARTPAPRPPPARAAGGLKRKDTTRGVRSFAQRPVDAVKYVKRLEELVECPVSLLSTSPDRDDTILVKDPFVD